MIIIVRLEQGVNDLLTLRPQLIQEWDWEYNNRSGLYPNNVTIGSRKSAAWKCSKCSHFWITNIHARATLGRGCPACAGQAINKFNSLGDLYPQLLIDWEYELNKELGIDPYNITAGSKKQVYWRCNICNHIWTAIPYSRTKNKTGCPSCSGRVKNNNGNFSASYKSRGMISGFNDLATLRPELLKEWDYEKNDRLQIFPDKITEASTYEAWWKCKKCGHEWKSRVEYRTSANRGCACCAGKVAIGANSIDSGYPEIAAEWDHAENSKLGIFLDTTPAGSHKIVNWICSKCDKKWRAAVESRTRGTGCPHCSAYGTSYSEQFIYSVIKQIFNKAKHRYKTTNGIEYDIAIPELNTLIEYNGYTHKYEDVQKRDNYKRKLCEDHGLRLIVVEDYIGTEDPIWICGKIQFLYKTSDRQVQLRSVCEIILNQLDVKLEPDYVFADTEANRYTKGKIRHEHSFGYKNNHIVCEWDSEKNTGTPYDYMPNSNVKVNWVCKECGHSWAALIAKRNIGQGCPVCAKLKQIKN